jgi:hypothetical protein
MLPHEQYSKFHEFYLHILKLNQSIISQVFYISHQVQKTNSLCLQISNLKLKY